MEIRYELINKLYEMRTRNALARAELRQDPENCFGGRGNNFGENQVESFETEYAELALTLTAEESAILTSKVTGKPIDPDRVQLCSVCHVWHKPSRPHITK